MGDGDAAAIGEPLKDARDFEKFESRRGIFHPLRERRQARDLFPVKLCRAALSQFVTTQHLPAPNAMRVHAMLVGDKAGIRRYVWSVTLERTISCPANRELRFMLVRLLRFLGQVVIRSRKAEERFLEARLALELCIFAVNVS